MRVLALDQKALECTEPLRQRVLIWRAEPEILLLRDDLHAVLLASGHRVDVYSIYDARERYDVCRGVFLARFVEGETFGAQDHPDLLPLSHPSFRLEHV